MTTRTRTTSSPSRPAPETAVYYRCGPRGAYVTWADGTSTTYPAGASFASTPDKRVRRISGWVTRVRRLGYDTQVVEPERGLEPR